MFTIKVREARNDVEVVFESKGVRKALHPERGADDTFLGRVTCDLPNGGEISYDIRGAAPANGIDDQTMYVMNDAGNTVAVFHL